MTIIGQTLHVTECQECCSPEGRCTAQAAAAGKIPEEVLKADADALARGTALPYARIDSAGVTPVSGAPSNTPRQAGPLDHS